jgi:hypothetical protein
MPGAVLTASTNHAKKPYQHGDCTNRPCFDCFQGRIPDAVNSCIVLELYFSHVTR